MYFKGYGSRIKPIIAVIVICVLSLLVPFALFHGKAENISGQLETYQYSDYEKQYILNYDIPLENECLYPDSDLLVFKDNKKESRLTISTIMAKQGSRYSLEYLKVLNSLNTDEIAISENIAQSYDLEVGDLLFVEYPYSSELRTVTIKAILSIDFDYLNPNVSNNIGIAFIGNDQTYQSSIQSKAILYTNDSKADELSKYPQAINSIIEKTANQKKVFSQGLTVFLYEIAFVVLSIVLSQLVLYSKSQRMLKRCYFKGMAKKGLIFVPLLEKIVFGLIPILIVQTLLKLSLPKSQFTEIYYLIPCVLYALFCIYTGLRDTILVRRR